MRLCRHHFSENKVRVALAVISGCEDLANGWRNDDIAIPLTRNSTARLEYLLLPERYLLVMREAYYRPDAPFFVA
ncbi:hypothetical protein PM082_016056 [Marasmius tenuissimus]|nr:hypothetical protein PM082_016056 [Marasmius tenuissimus]